MRLFKRVFISGLTLLIPLAITIYVLVGLFKFADGILGKYINQILYERIDFVIPGLGILLFILIVFLLGVVVEISRMRFFGWFTASLERMFFSIPLVKKIYSPVRQIVTFLFFPRRKTFKNTVLIEYPRKGVFVIGFMTNENTIEFPQKRNKKYYSVFIPSSPSPITGFTIIVEESEVVFLDIAVDEAIKLIVSGGLLNPYEE
jgi:uncharacterized membrane protein